MKKLFLACLTSLFFLISCNKNNDGSSSSNNNYVSINDGTTTRTLNISPGSLFIRSGIYSTVRIICLSNSDVELTLIGYSSQAPDGTGNYGTTTSCSVVEHFSGGLVFDGKNTGVIIPGTGSVKCGDLTVTQKDSHYMIGTFSFVGKASTGAEKTFSGNFKFNYQ